MAQETRSKEKTTKAELKRKINIWKVICLTLLLIIIGFFVYIYLAIFVFSPTEEPTPKLISNKQMVEFQSSTTKNDLNKLIATYIDDFSNDQDIGYDVYVADNVIFKAKAEIFNEPITMKLTFSPKVVDDGNVELKLKDMSVGALPLPVSYVMGYVNDNYKFPDWVTVIPKKKEIYLDLTKLKLKGDTKVRMDTLDLKKDDISFTLLVPVD
ncbi:YpmS family protein [Listeria costaricensis]|uniref:YpmS family protein n=1 Tax=Listeria costaricensis TaxID=2026604 RepID=UPI000C06D6C3|nr:YpmS family protein [Listeria costaricensis]